MQTSYTAHDAPGRTNHIVEQEYVRVCSGPCLREGARAVAAVLVLPTAACRALSVTASAVQ